MNFLAARCFFTVGSQNTAIFHLKQFFDSRSYLRNKNSRAPAFDVQFQTVIAEYQRYHRLRIQDGSLNAETYARIGREMSHFQIDTTSIGHPILKKLLFGITTDDICASWETIAPIIPKDKFIGWGYKFLQIPKVCFQYSWEQLKVMGHDLKSPGWGTNKKMNPHIYQLYLTDDVAGMKKGVQAQQFTDGVLYLKNAIKNKIPVLVGVDDAPKAANTDKVTDHFVTIVGMGTDSAGKYFLFFDNSTGNVNVGTSSQNRLYCDCENFTVIGHADPASTYGQGGYGQYQVTQIRESK